MCGATDCPSCGPAQGYTVVKVWRNGRYVYVNPEEDDDGMAALEDEGFDLDCDGPDEHAADLASDRYQRDIDARHP